MYVVGLLVEVVWYVVELCDVVVEVLCGFYFVVCYE